MESSKHTGRGTRRYRSPPPLAAPPHSGTPSREGHQTLRPLTYAARAAGTKPSRVPSADRPTAAERTRRPLRRPLRRWLWLCGLR